LTLQSDLPGIGCRSGDRLQRGLCWRAGRGGKVSGRQHGRLDADFWMLEKPAIKRPIAVKLTMKVAMKPEG
jgi:hypothetical protein